VYVYQIYDKLVCFFVFLLVFAVAEDEVQQKIGEIRPVCHLRNTIFQVVDARLTQM
jgi:hypothetical protein